MAPTDAETELRAKFAQTAKEIPVGPPPTGASLRAGTDRASRTGRRRRTWRAFAVAAAAGGIVAATAVPTNVLDGGPEDSETPAADVSASGSPPPRLQLDCPNNMRISTTFDIWEPNGAASPASSTGWIVDRVGGETVHVVEHEGWASVWILRPDRTPRARVTVRDSAEHGGWVLDTGEWCAGERLVPPRDRP